MPKIHVDTDLIISLSSDAMRKLRGISDTRSAVSSLKSSQDSRILARRGIGSRLSNAVKELETLDQRIRAVYGFAQNAMDKYKAVDNSLAKEAGNIGQMRAKLASVSNASAKQSEKPKEKTPETAKLANLSNTSAKQQEKPKEKPAETKDPVQAMIDNLSKDTSLKLTKEKKDTLVYMAKLLLKEGYDPRFVAGVLGNILAEGSVGMFESSNYKSNPKKEPDYLKYMDKYHDYRKDYSGKNISEVGIEKTKELLDELEDEGYKGKFGLGCVQWTGERTMGLIDCYIKVCGEKGFPTKEQCIEAESMFILQELKGSYKNVYTNWKSKYGNSKDGDAAAKAAGSVVCKEYEKPKDPNQAGIRGNNAEKIYDVMMGKK
ncbi:phage tail tip lysozyme [Cohnella mopanensis]|uniref:phage tail tip lysozyme n=1 Tax=Cohnella mopanensis TaxID=2911966 RepID=UPI001EF7DD73|nr:phage tail tip lysozyme [Cohnella mopanensis]